MCLSHGSVSAFVAAFLLVTSSVQSEDFLLNKNKFPDDFLFGVATSAYQIEGGYNAGGKGKNIWDHFTKKNPEKFAMGENGNVACDSFHKYKEDVQLLKNFGVQFYRFSISWSRVLPDGYSNNVNKDGLRYYNDLIDELLANGIQPMVTIYHWDLPLPLQQLGGWTNPYLAYYFEDYARILFSYFGDRVKYWLTFNTNCDGYGDDVFPPFLKQPGVVNYLCHHVTLLAHAKVYHLYDDEFRMTQKGKVGLVVDGRWFEPATSSPEDIEAADRAKEFITGIFTNPVYHPEGDYPKVVKERVFNVSRQEGYLQSRLPVFSKQELEYVQGTYDFLGMNIYATYLAKDKKEEELTKSSFDKDMRVEAYLDDDWPKTNTEGLRVVPEGLRKILKWAKEKYDDPEIIITENGMSDQGDLNDIGRIKYHVKYMSAVLDAIYEDKVNVKAYAAWSLMDNLEWVRGYRERFGFYHVDFKDPNRKRTPKKSVKWYKKVIRERRVVELKDLTS